MKHIAGLIIICLFGAIQSIFAQSGVRIVDAGTNEAIPFANIQFANTNLLSNAEGVFTLPEGLDDNAPIVISFMGYAAVQTTQSAIEKANNTVRMTPQVYQLDEVKVSERPTADAIMEQVRANLSANHSGGSTGSKSLVFVRESELMTPKKINIEITKADGLSKKNLRAVNEDIARFSRRLTANTAKEYTDLLGDYARMPNGKGSTLKFIARKAVKLRDASKATSMDEMQKSGQNLVLKHLDTTKKYRVRSGWFGSNDTIQFNKSRGKKKNTPLTRSKDILNGIAYNASPLNPIHKYLHEPDRYKYTYDGTVMGENGEFLYVITFVPDSRKGIYKGKLYISESDFGIYRAEYKLAEGKKAGGINVKWLLGIKAVENVSSGVLLFKRYDDGRGYRLRYASIEDGQYMYLNRPVEFIEHGGEEKEVLGLKLKFEGDIYSKTEFLDLQSEPLAADDFEKMKEKEFSYLQKERFDPELWKDEGVLAPLDEMKRFEVSGSL